jgi:hypothetical protein
VIGAEGIATPRRRGVAFRVLAMAGVDAYSRSQLPHLHRRDARAQRRFNTLGVNTPKGRATLCGSHRCTHVWVRLAIDQFKIKP